MCLSVSPKEKVAFNSLTLCGIGWYKGPLVTKVAIYENSFLLSSLQSYPDMIEVQLQIKFLFT